MPRTLTLLVLTLALVAGVRAHVCAQDAPHDSAAAQMAAGADDIERANRLLAQGDATGAVKVLRAATERDKDNSAAWHQLGIVLARAGQTNDAREALDRAIFLRALAFDLELSQQRSRDGKLSVEESAARRARFAAKVKGYIESLEKLNELDPAESRQQTLKTLHLYLSVVEDPRFDATPFRAARLFKKAVITSKPDPVYTERARRNDVSGVVRLRAVLDADGTVRNLQAINGLGDGLTEQAVRAARRIKFKPATIDGHPVSQYIVLEYNFHVY